MSQEASESIRCKLKKRVRVSIGAKEQVANNQFHFSPSLWPTQHTKEQPPVRSVRSCGKLATNNRHSLLANDFQSDQKIQGRNIVWLHWTAFEQRARQLDKEVLEREGEKKVVQLEEQVQ